MKYLYRISLIFMILTILSALILAGYSVYRLQDKGGGETEPEKEEKIAQTASASATTDCDTEYVILEQDLNTGECESVIQDIPAKYIGKSKEQLSSLLKQEERAPSLKDRQKGIQSIRLSAFSGDRVVVVKTYEIAKESAEAEESAEESTKETAEESMAQPQINEAIGGYYLMAYDGFLYIYYEDMQTVYLTTEIQLDQLPDDVRQEVLDKKYLKDEEELYNFLESYSS